MTKREPRRGSRDPFPKEWSREIFLIGFFALGTLPRMDTKTAIAKAGGRERLALLLEVSAVTTYAWKVELPRKHERFLRLKRPDWFQGEPPLRPAPKTLSPQQRQRLKQGLGLMQPAGVA